MPGLGHRGAISSITGAVLGTGDRPLPGVCVTAHSLSRTSAGAIGAAAIAAITRADGRYVLAGLRPGAYTVSYRDCAQPRSYFEQWSPGAGLASGARPVLVGRTQIRLAPVHLRPTSQAAFISASAARLRPRADAGQLASVSGIVRNRSGKRLKGICVYIYPKGNYFAGVGGSTRKDGSYGFPGFFSPGRYQVQFTAGCPNGGNYAPQYWKYAASPSRARVLRLRAGQRATGINARLGPGGELSGTVRAANTGKPLKGVCVNVISVKPAYVYQFLAVTDAHGRYFFKAMATGRYQMDFHPDCGNKGNYLALYPRGTVKVTAGKRTDRATAKLPPGAGISGVVTGPGGRSVAGICVLDDSNYPVAQTRADGSYSIIRLGAQPNYLAFEGGCGNHGNYAPQYYPGQANPASSLPVNTSLGQVITGVNASLSVGGEVTGVVTSTAGRRLSGICVAVLTPSALEPNYQNLFIGFNGEIPFASTASTHAGVYRIGNLAPGQYYAVFGPCNGTRYPYEWFKDQGAFGRASLISVGAAAVTAGVDAVLPPSGTISGTVTDGRGRRLSRVCVYAYNLAGQDWITQSQASSHHGTYKITGLAPGGYAVWFSTCSLSGAFASQWYPAAASEQAARAVRVRSGRDTKRVNVTLSGGGSISGRVIDAATGRPVSFCGGVIAVDSAGNYVAGALVSNDGRYRFGHLLAGRYTLQACGFGLVNKPNVVVRGTRPTTGVMIVLPDTGSLAGRVLNSAGTTPEAGVCVTAFPRTGSGYVAVAATGLDGRWRLDGMNPGSYRVLFSPVCMAGFPQVAPQWFDNKPDLRSATPVNIVADQTTVAINAKMATPGGISGTVTDSAHAAVRGICVSALPVAGNAVPVSGITTGTGRFSIAQLPPGKYLVRFEPGCGANGYLTQWYSGALTKSGATPVTVVAGNLMPDVNAVMKR